MVLQRLSRIPCALKLSLLASFSSTSFFSSSSLPEFERICHRRLALLHAGDHIRTAEPVGFRQVRRRPPGGMVRMRMIEADDIFSALAAFALDGDQFLRIDVVAVVRRVLAVLPQRAARVAVFVPSHRSAPAARRSTRADRSLHRADEGRRRSDWNFQHREMQKSDSQIADFTTEHMMSQQQQETKVLKISML